ncbi:TrkH family potassium uptake protein [Zongyangia hominis]|uniref:TrkH family potassium uptake protein n=1 Tax=Zongyangia hominis TaxID=2763677 RepID=A0A926I6G0_9FIRM|nr:TrkH family potassium uptake protein [Zongyangia hominis]MBC8570014.1 TrkH family potassium uptake protein [Zongyangia hominis]
MNYKVIYNIIGRILCVEAAFLVPAVAISTYYQETGAIRALWISIVAIACVGVLLLLPRPVKKDYYAREGYISVGLSWIIISLFGALPFYLSGEVPSYLDAVFETISGFTTTGASILENVEVMSRGLLYWRSFTHWLGGMGVLVFVLALHPMARGSGQSLHLLRAESPGPEVGKLVPKIHKSAKILYGIYIGLTLLQIVLLALGGMPLFDNVTTVFGTAGTGGFAVRADSMAGYSPYIQTVITIFMALFGVNFSVFYLFLSGHPRQALRSEEVRLYIGILAGATLLITLNILPHYANAGEALHHAAFQVSSIMTTTGFATTDFNLWPEFSKCILLLLMIVGACAGSTGGGIKVSRLLLLIKSMRMERKRILHPRSVSVISLDQKPISDETMRGVTLFMTAYFFTAALSFLIVSLDNMGLETSLSAVLACINNIGPGLDIVGPMGNYAAFSPLSKLVLCADMLLGRLEIIPLLMLFAPSAWTKGIRHKQKASGW